MSKQNNIIHKFTINFIKNNTVNKVVVRSVQGGDYDDVDEGYDKDIGDTSDANNVLFDDGSNAQGGDYDDVDEGYDEDIGDVSNAYNAIFDDELNAINTQGGNEFDELFTETIVVNKDKKMVVLRTDSWSDLKCKIQYMFDIPVSCQYMYDNTHTQHKLFVDGDEIDMTYKNKNIEDLEDIEIYGSVAANAIEVIKLEGTLFIGDMTSINVVDYRDNNIYDTLTSDARDIYYYEYIFKYWPTLDKQVNIMMAKTVDYAHEVDVVMVKSKPIFDDVIQSCDITVANKSIVVDIKELFNFIHIGDDVQVVRASYFDNVLDSNITLLKTAVGDDRDLYHDKLDNEICIYINIDNKLIKFRINIHGEQLYQLVVNNVYNKELMFNIVSPINKLIRRINDGLHYKLGSIKISSIHITNITASIDTENNNPLSTIASLGYIRFHRRLANNIDEYVVEYFNHYDWHRLLDSGVNTYTNTLISDIKAEKRIRLVRNLTSTKIIVVGLDEDEYVFYKTLFVMTPSQVSTTSTYKNNIKALMNKDVVLFNLKKQDSPYLYTKLCQKKNQPVMYFKNELDSMNAGKRKRLVKWWNFTTNEHVYYDCPNRDKPYFTFIVGKHPLDYCLPCCGQTKHSLDDQSHKKDIIYEKCMIDHVYVDNKMANDESKYIFNYGKSIEVDRLINIINSKLRKLFASIYSPSSKTENYYGIGVLSDDSFLESILLCLNITYNAFTERVSARILNDASLYYRLIDGNIVRYFTDVHDFIHKLKRREISSLTMLYEDILYYIFNVRVLRIIDKGNVYIKNKHYDALFSGSFIVLIKNSIYFPVCSLVPIQYFKSKDITQRTFTRESSVVTKIFNMLDTVNVKSVTTTETQLTYRNIRETLGNEYAIVHGFYNNMQHVMLLDIVRKANPSQHVCLPIEPIHIDEYIGATSFILEASKLKINRDEVLMFVNKHFNNAIVKKRYVEYSDTYIPLYDIFDSSYDNPFYIGYLVTKSYIKPMSSKQYKSNIDKSFAFIHDMKALLADTTYATIISMVDHNDHKNARKSILKLIKHKEYADVIIQLLSDKVFRSYLQYDFKDKLLEFSINSNEKIIIE